MEHHIFLLLKPMQNGGINFDEFLNILNEIVRHGFRLKEEILIEATKRAKRIADRK